MDPTELRTAIQAAASGEPYMSRSHAAAMETTAVDLSDREAEALRYFAGGMTMVEVAKVMNVKASTVKGYLDRVRAKYSDQGRPVHHKLDLRQRAIEDGVLSAAELVE